MGRIQTFIDGWQRRGRRKQRRDGAPAGVLFTSSGGLGDTILLAHVIERFESSARADEPMTILLRKDAAKTAFLFPKQFEVIPVDFTKLRKDNEYRTEIADSLYAANYRLAISLDYLRHPFLDEFLLLSAEAQETIAMAAKPWPKYEKDLARNAAEVDRIFESGAPVQDKVDRWARYAGWLNGEQGQPLSFSSLVPKSDEDRETGSPFVMIQAFSAVKQKQCHPETFRKAIDAIPADWEIVFTGAPGEDADNLEFASLLELPRARYDDSTFQDLVPKLQAARFAISVDTAFMHLAIAAGTPTIGLASAAYVGEIVPYLPEMTPDWVQFIYHDMPCRGCLGDCSLPFEDDRYPCIARLEPDRVRNAVADMVRDIRK